MTLAKSQDANVPSQDGVNRLILHTPALSSFIQVFLICKDLSI